MVTTTNCLPRALMASLSLAVFSVFPARSRADNPIVQTLYTTDPAPLAYDGKVYVYTGHDEDNLVNNFFTMNDWRVYSTSDMVNWTDHGSPLNYNDFSWSKGDAWAGQVIPRNGKFYYYIPTTSASLGRMAIGVAVSDSPTGPFVDALGQPLITENCADIDPTVYIDDDGQAYLYWGNPNLCYVKLNEDMISYSGSVVHVPMTTESFGVRVNDTSRDTSYEEGPWFYKRGDLYYMVYAAGPISEHIGYATSSSPTGPWTYGGVVMPSQGASFTNHPGVVDFMGNSYFFYHNGALPDGGGFHRSVSAEQFSYNADGSWPNIDMTTDGAPAVAHLDPYVETEAETIAWESDIETEPCSEGGMDVTAISDGDYIKVENVNFRTGALSFDARVASGTSGGNIELRLDSVDGTLVGTCAVSNTGGAQNWTTVSTTVSGATGVHDLYFKFTGGGDGLFNFNWWSFVPIDPPDAGVVAMMDSDGSMPNTGGEIGGALGSGGITVSGSGATIDMGLPSGGLVGSTGGQLFETVGSDGSSSGCGCRIGVNHRQGPHAISLLLIAVLLFRVRRPRRAMSSRT